MPGDAPVHEYHYFTVDGERVFQIVALQRFPRHHWESFQSRVETAIDQILALLAVANESDSFHGVGAGGSALTGVPGP